MRIHHDVVSQIFSKISSVVHSIVPMSLSKCTTSSKFTEFSISIKLAHDCFSHEETAHMYRQTHSMPERRELFQALKVFKVQYLLEYYKYVIHLIIIRNILPLLLTMD